jgi:hypothetical protein
MAAASIHSFSSSSEIAEGTYFNKGGTVTIALGIWTHRMHRSGKDKTGACRWYWFTVIGNNNKKKIYVTCYRVCTRPPVHLIGSVYYQKYHMMEQEIE